MAKGKKDNPLDTLKTDAQKLKNLQEMEQLHSDIAESLEKQRAIYDEMAEDSKEAKDLQEEITELAKDHAKALKDVNTFTADNKDLLDKLQKKQEEFNNKVDKMVGHLTNFTDKIPLVGKSISKYMTAGADKAKKSFETFTNSGEKGMKSLTKTMMANPIFLIVAVIVAIITLIVKLIKMGEKYNQEVKSLRKEFGLTKSAGEAMYDTLAKGVSAATLEKKIAAYKTMGTELGYLPKITDKLNSSLKELTFNIGMSTDGAGKLLAFVKQTDISFEKYKSTLSDVISKENKRNKIQVSGLVITEKISNLGADIRLMYKGQTGELIKQVAATTRLGISMSKARDIARGMLDIESSIEAQFTAQMLTGKQLNFDEARRLQMAGKFGEAAEVIRNQVGDISKMDLIQQDAIAAATGMSIEELAGAQLKSEATGQMAVAAGLEHTATGMDEMKESLGGMLAEIPSAISKRIAPAVESLANYITGWTGGTQTVGGKTETGEEVSAQYETLGTKGGLKNAAITSIISGIMTGPGGMGVGFIKGLMASKKVDAERKATAMKTAGIVTAADSIKNVVGGSEKADDFIMRPGKKPIKFNKDDLIIGGTNLTGTGGGVGGDNEVLERLDRLIALVEEGKTIEMDGIKVAEALSLSKLEVGVA